jgi:hypothetical protein
MKMDEHEHTQTRVSVIVLGAQAVHVDLCACGAIRVRIGDATSQWQWDPPVEWLSVTEAARRVGVTPGAIRTACRVGRLDARRAVGGGDWLIDPIELSRFAESRLGVRGRRA